MTHNELKKADQRRIIKLVGEQVIAAIREEWNAQREIENTLGHDVEALRDFFEHFAIAGVSRLTESDIDDLIDYAHTHAEGLPHNHPDYKR